MIHLTVLGVFDRYCNLELTKSLLALLKPFYLTFMSLEQRVRQTRKLDRNLKLNFDKSDKEEKRSHKFVFKSMESK